MTLKGDHTPTWEQWQAQEQLRSHASKAPHVNGSTVTEPQQHLRAPVEPALNVAEEGASLKAGTAKVDEFQLA